MYVFFDSPMKKIMATDDNDWENYRQFNFFFDTCEQLYDINLLIGECEPK